MSSATTQTYRITARAASGSANTSFRVLVDGVSLGSRPASSGGWQTWQDRVYDNVFALRFDAGGRCSDFTEWYVKRP